MAAGAVEAAVGRGGEVAAAPLGEALVEALDGAGLAAGLGDPVERQPDADHDEQGDAEQLGALELRPLQLLVGEVGLAVGRQLDLGAGLGPSVAQVPQQVHEPADDEDDGDDHPDRGGRGGEDHAQCPPPVMQCGPSASWPVVFVPIGRARG